MRRTTLELIRCPRCQAPRLVPDGPATGPTLSFGPVRCLGCGARFPVHDGLIDLVTEPHRSGLLQRAMDLPWVARSWERYLRPVVDSLTRGALDLESEYVLLRSMLGEPSGPLLDLGCGSGLFVRRLAKDFPELPVVGLDLSRAMLEEAIAQMREHGATADLVRAHTPPLPFNNGCLGAVLAAGVGQFVPNLDALLIDVARVLQPGGRWVATTWSNSGWSRVHRAGGLFPRSEEDLRTLVEQAGLSRFERVRMGRFFVYSARAPLRSG